ncbi:MAG: glycerate kinase [Ilumatobacteraceae bacterium]
MHVLAVVDKFRGTATAPEVAGVIARALRADGHECDPIPVSDGGEGWLDAFGGQNRSTVVTGPLGDDVRAGWRLDGRTAVIEMARAAGLDLVGGAEGNDALAASTTGVGELIDAALDGGARRILIGLGGSATTDGGFGALRSMRTAHRLRNIELLVACDVRTHFTDAARVFGPQKGATPAQVALLTGRLERLVQLYVEEYGTDVSQIEGAGAAGGLAGGLCAIGGELLSGFSLIADELDLAERIADADLVVTGEGYLDAQSFDGKVVGSVAELCASAGTPVIAVVGDVDPEVRDRIEHISLVERFGTERAFGDTIGCLERLAASLVAG